MKRATLPVGPEALAPETVRELLRILAWLFRIINGFAAADLAWPPVSDAEWQDATIATDMAEDDEGPVYVAVPAPWSLRYTRVRRAVARPMHSLALWLWRCARPPCIAVPRARMAMHAHV